MSEGKRRYQIRAVERALNLLGVFSTSEPELSLMELSSRLGLNPSTIYRLLVTLEGQGYIERNRESGRYRLGVACLKVGSVFLSQVELRERVRPVLEELRNECKETVHLAILDRERMEVVYFDKLEGLLPIGVMGSRVGGRAPAHCTGLGKCLLAHEDEGVIRHFYATNGLRPYTSNTIARLDGLLGELTKTRERGYVIDNEEHEPDVKCIAAPIRNHQGEVVGAISVAGPVGRMDRLIAEEGLIDKVKGMAAVASWQMGAPITD